MTKKGALVNDITPAQAQREAFRWAPAVLVIGVLAVLVGAAICLVGWKIDGWFTNASANRQAHQTQNGYSNQTTLHQQVTANIATVTSLTTQIDGAASGQQAADLKAQRMAIAGTACEDAAQVSTADPLPAQQQQWVVTNCANGSVSPSSALYQAGTS
jgi:hypothetical protein